MIDKNIVRNTIGAPLFESKRLACCITDSKLNFVFVNKAFINISGYSEEDLIGKSIASLLTAKAFKRATKEFTNFVKNGFLGSDKWFYITRKGEVLDATVETSQINIEGKKYTLSIALDASKVTELENKLSQEKNRLQSTVEGAYIGLWDLNFISKEFYANDIWWKMLGYSPNESNDVKRFYTNILHTDDIHIVQNELHRIVKTGDPIIDIEVRLRTKKGDYKWIKSRGKVIEFGEKNYINHAIGIHTDITKEKDNQLAILESERKYRTLTESIPSIVWTADTNGYLNYMNLYGLKYFGEEKTNFNDWRWKDYIHPDNLSQADESWYKGKEATAPISIINRLKRKDNTHRWFQVLIIPQVNKEGTVDSWTGIATDIEKRIQSEESLKLSNNRLRSLINASPIAIYSINTDGIVQDFWNPAAERLLGWNREEAIGQFLPHVKEKHRSEFMELVKTTKELGVLNRTVSRIDKNGNEVIIEVTGGCIYNENGKVSEILVTVMDMTEVEHSRKKIQQSLKEKETLLQEIHHRVKNNLAIIVSLLQLQVFRSEDKSEKYRLTEAQNRVHSIAMVHELLYQSEDFSSVDLKTYYHTLLSTIAGNMKIGTEEIKTALEIGIDSLNINQAIPLGLLINELATNSFKYAFNENPNNGLITLTISRQGDYIFVTYKDNGPGFDMSTTNFKSGLGMQIIDSLLQQLDADYTIDPNDYFELTLSFKEKELG